ncbi:MAG: YraN family protein [Planctomycetota bacterium]
MDRRSRKRRRRRSKDRGSAGERWAARLIERHGLEVIARNWTFSGGEIDLIARDGQELVLIEVKTRRPGAERFIDRAQLGRIARAAPLAMATHGSARLWTVRLDLIWIEVTPIGKVTTAEWWIAIDPQTGASDRKPPRCRPWWWRSLRSLRFVRRASRFHG